MTTDTARVGSAVVLTVGGEVDLHTAPELVDTVVAALHRPAGVPPTATVVSVVADLTGVAFLSSAGLGTLVALSTRLGDDEIALRLVGGENQAVTRPVDGNAPRRRAAACTRTCPAALDPVA